MRPPPRLTVSQWADTYRQLSSESSAEPGRWSTARAEFQRGILDAMSDPTVEEAWVKKSAQVGWTEIINNTVGYYIHQDPAPILVLQPTVEMAETWSKDRLEPMARDTPVIRVVLGEAKSRDSKQTVLQKTFPGGRLTAVGANSPASLASRPIRIILCDEVNRYPPSAGREGDPIKLGHKRSTTFWNRKLLCGSTPTIKGRSRITAGFEASDQRFFFVPCPHCDVRQVLEWKNVRWTGDDASTAAIHCTGCGVGWTDAERNQAVSRGEWRATKPFRGIAGFHICELYSPWSTIERVVAAFIEARGNPHLLKVWTNTVLGEDFEEAGEAPEWERLFERREDVQAGLVPDGAVVLTAGIDNQAAPARLEWAVWAWGPGFERWLVDAGVIPGDPAAVETWDAMAAVLDRDWPREEGGTLRIAKVGVDTGGQHTQGVYTQLRRLRDGRLVPLKGRSGVPRGSAVNGPKAVDVTTGGKKLARGLRLWIVFVDEFKAELYRALWLTPRADGTRPAGWVHLPGWMNDEQVKQLTAEQLVTHTDRAGFQRTEWRASRANEQLDLAVYARAALNVLGADRYGERFWTKTSGGPAARRSRSVPVASATTALSPAPASAVPQAAPARQPTVLTAEAPAAVRGRESRLARLSMGG